MAEIKLLEPQSVGDIQKRDLYLEDVLDASIRINSTSTMFSRESARED